VPLKRQGIMDAIKAATDTKADRAAKEGGLMAVECLCSKLGRMFEPYIITVLPMLLGAFSDSAQEVRAASACMHAMRIVLRACMRPCAQSSVPAVNSPAVTMWRCRCERQRLMRHESSCAT
jgi:hypothetical protein